MKIVQMRIGHGYDVHRLAPGKELILGGVTIPHYHRIVAHSDGDVLLHALCDALLGASGNGDIGQHFPDSSPQYKGVSSRKLLRQVFAFLKAQGYTVANIDATIIAQAPKLAPFICYMQENIAKDLDIQNQQINIKATTTEGMGYIGKEQGIAAHVVVLLYALAT